MPITAEQFATTLENMARAWENIPAEERMPKDDDKSFFNTLQYNKDMGLELCKEIIQRWHSGESSHPDREELANEYPDSAAGYNQLREDLFAVQGDPFVTAADLQLQLVK